jgi:hypothetical protein
MALRVVHLSHPPLSLDEAESAINALTILQHGYPSDHYLGLPLYENTLTRTWPQSAEYEFRDTSYSDKGVAIYHGWLPLYAMAASFAVAGIEPDVATDPPRVQREVDEFRLRTIAARAPSVVFAAGFLAAVCFATREMAGKSAAAVALVVAALAEPCVRVAREARYYSATLLIGTLCCWAVFRILRRGRWVDFAFAAVALVAAFHTHVLTFAVACIIIALSSFWWLRRPGAWPRAAALVAAVALGTLPWALAVGWFHAGAKIPSAWAMLVMPDDLVAYLREHLPIVAIALAAAGVLLLAFPGIARRMPARLAAPLPQNRTAVALTLVWIVVGAVVFILLVPAPSAFFWRMTLPVQGAVVILAAALVASAAAVVAPRHAGWVAVIVAAAFFARPRERFADFRTPPPLLGEPLVDTIDYLRTQPLDRSTKLYAVPLHHFPLMFYSGLPIQSVAPVRSAFLDAYGGEVIVIDSAPRQVPVPRALIADAAADLGGPINDATARQWEKSLEARILSEDVAARTACVEPRLDELPEFAAEAVRRARSRAPKQIGDGRWQNPAVFRGFESYHKADFWPIFFYRFVNPTARSGDRLNYARRIRNATATVLPEGWVVYRSPAPVAESVKR